MCAFFKILEIMAISNTGNEVVTSDEPKALQFEIECTFDYLEHRL